MASASPQLSPLKSSKFEWRTKLGANMKQFAGVRSAPQAEESLKSTPDLVHTLRNGKASILSVAADDRYIYSGSQANEIFVWEVQTLQIKAKLVGHTGSVLTLECCPEKQWLFSAAADSTVRVWSTTHLSLLYVIIPEGETDAGEIFSFSYSPTLSTVYFGCQNTSLQWLDLSQATKLKAKGGSPVRSSNGTTILPSKRWHKFFDSVPQPARTVNGSPTSTTGSTTPDRQLVHSPGDPAEALCASLRFTSIDAGPKALQVPPQNVILPAHYGFIYCMALSPSHLYSGDVIQQDQEIFLLTGSGDEDVKVWQCTKTGLLLRHTFNACDGGVLCLVARNGTVFGGCQDGHIKVWDLETKTLVRTLDIHPRPTVGLPVSHASSIDVLSMSMIGTDLYSVLSSGWCQRWDASFEGTAEWKAHDGIGLSSIVAPAPANGPESFPQEAFLITGGSDANIKLWTVEPPPSRREKLSDGLFERVEQNNLQIALATFISFPSISGLHSKMEDCRQAAIWLKQCLTQLGATATLIPLDEGINPLVLATFTGSEEYQNRPRILFYGHYDVTDVHSEGWESEPFKLSGRNGYLYGRGVSDNKGPVLAAAFAVSDLRRKLALGLDVVMLIEGEEESGSRGFKDAIQQHKEVIGHIDAIILCNSYWIGEDTPCITYGLRGVIHCSLEISSDQPDLHSGVEGGGAIEPMFDMVALLGSLSRDSQILIPGFYDQVRPRTEAEDGLYRLVAKVTGMDASYLASKWREPSLTIHAIEASSPGNRTVIPSRVQAQMSLRTVPDQNLHQIASSVENHLNSAFEALQSPNSFKVSIDRAADFWLGNLESPWFRALESAVEGEWGIKPLRIREGGSIPSIPLLEKCFGCGALHLPMGQSSDQAHLANERISVNNLLKGKAVLERFFLSVAQSKTLVV